MPLIDLPLEQLKSYTGRNPRPADFDVYWDRALAEMRAVDPKVELVPHDIGADAGVESFDLWFTGVRGARIHAQYLRPKGAKGRHPSVVQFHGYSGNAGEWTEKLRWTSLGFSVAAMDCRGQGGQSEDVGGVKGMTYKGHIVRGLEDGPDKLLFRDIYLDTAELAGIVMGMPEVDPARVGCTGGSQGGGLTLACAALEPRIRRAFPIYPFLCDYQRVWEMDLAKDAYEELRYWFRMFDPLHEREAEVFARLGYVDNQHLAPRIRAEVRMAVGLMDTVCPPSTQFAAYNRMTCPKSMLLYPDFGHEGLPYVNDRAFAFMAGAVAVYERNVSHVEALVKEQNEWRGRCINLIASENVTSRRTRGVMGSDFAHRYAEGHPGERYYQGTEIIDEIEGLLKQHMKGLFRCRHADVRPISGTIANDAVFSRYIKPGDVVMVNSTPGGGHISHHRVGAVGKYTKNIVNFPVTADGYHIDVERTLELLKALEPKVMILGKSLFLFPEPVKELAPACKRRGIALIYDAAHVLGLVAGHQFQDPLAEGAPLVTGSTHKTFFGSQRGVILSNVDDDEWRRIDKGAFPGSSSNHHLETLVALSVSTYEMLEFGVDYARQVVANAKHFARALAASGFKVEGEAFGFTESHQVAVDVSDLGGGDASARTLKDNGIIVNMNLLPFEPLDHVTNPAGLRMGVQEMTRVGMKESEMDAVAGYFKKVLIDKKFVGDEVKEFRAPFQAVQYSFDGS